MNLKFKQPYNGYIGFVDPTKLSFTTHTCSNVFCIDKKWYIRLKLTHEIEAIDNTCQRYAQEKNLEFTSNAYEGSFLVKVPYRYKKFEVMTYNCTLYDNIREKSCEVSIKPVGLSLINNKYTCTYKLESFKLNSLEKHPHAPLESGEYATMQ